MEAELSERDLGSGDQGLDLSTVVSLIPGGVELNDSKNSDYLSLDSLSYERSSLATFNSFGVAQLAKRSGYY